MEFMEREKENLMAVKDVEFSKFKKDVDVLLVKICGFNSDDLPDAPWYDYFDSEMSALDAIDTAIVDQWFDMPGLEEMYYAYVGQLEGV
jgi:hypothetical protein